MSVSLVCSGIRFSAVCTETVYRTGNICRSFCEQSLISNQRKIVLLSKNLRRKRGFLKLYAASYYSSLWLCDRETGHRCAKGFLNLVNSWIVVRYGQSAQPSLQEQLFMSQHIVVLGCRIPQGQ